MFKVAYDGSKYHGFQRQDNAWTVQEAIEDGLKTLLKEDVKIIGASRTDAGVHAKGQVFNLKVDTPIPVERFPLALNTKLPRDIIIIDTIDVDDDFHARYNSKDKVYSYQIYNNNIPSPFVRNYAYHIKRKLDLNKMREGASYLIGKYDFSSFRSAGCNAKTSIREIFSIDIEKSNNLIVIRIKGGGFLYKMVRIIMGTLIKVGLNKIDPKGVQKILLAKDRQQAGPTAPACGLFLEKIYY